MTAALIFAGLVGIASELVMLARYAVFVAHALNDKGPQL